MKWILNLSDMLSSLEIIILVAELKIQLAFTKKPQQAEIYSDDELDIAERVASDLGGTIRKIYVSDKE